MSRPLLFDLPIDQWPTSELMAILRDRYTASPVPPCRVCGGKLSIASVGGIQPTVWACEAWEDDPDRPGERRQKVGRAPADTHFANSRWTQNYGGDQIVLEALRRLEVRTEAIEIVRRELDVLRAHTLQS